MLNIRPSWVWEPPTAYSAERSQEMQGERRRSARSLIAVSLARSSFQNQNAPQAGLLPKRRVNAPFAFDCTGDGLRAMPTPVPCLCLLRVVLIHL